MVSSKTAAIETGLYLNRAGQTIVKNSYTMLILLTPWKPNWYFDWFMPINKALFPSQHHWASDLQDYP